MNCVYLILSALTLCVHGMHIKELIALSLSQPKITYQWNQLEFNFPNHHARQQAENYGNFKPFNAFPIDVQPHYYYKNRLRTFVTIPRLQDGIPFTLATVSDIIGINGPLLEPYPNYELHNNNNGKNCDSISSAFRMAVCNEEYLDVTINECNQMWVIDSGFVGPDSQCPPQLLLFDLNTDQLIHRYQFKTSLYTPKASLFVTPIVIVRDPPPRGSCQHTMVYVADAKYHGLVVYDFMQNNAWRIENRFMYPDPNHGLLSVAGERFILIDGILGLATDKTNLYFHPLASAMEYAVSLKVIDNSTLFENNKGNMYEAFRPLGTRKSECVASAMDCNNNLYCVTLNPIELTIWNVNTPYNSYNIKKIHMNPEILQFVSGIKVVRNHHGNEELWMLSNRSQKIISGTQDFNEVNFRIVVISLVNRSYFKLTQLGYTQQWVSEDLTNNK